MEQAIFEILSGDMDVATIIGDRIYPVGVPEGESLPAVTYQRIAEAPDYNIQGRSSISECMFQINCWAGDYDKACELADAVRDALEDYSGVTAGVVIEMIELSSEGDMPVIMPENENLNAYGRRFDFRIHYQV